MPTYNHRGDDIRTVRQTDRRTAMMGIMSGDLCGSWCYTVWESRKSIKTIILNMNMKTSDEAILVSTFVLTLVLSGNESLVAVPRSAKVLD